MVILMKKRPEKSFIDFCHCFITISSLLWALVVWNICKNSFAVGKSTKQWCSCSKNQLLFVKNPENCWFSWVLSQNCLVFLSLEYFKVKIFYLCYISFHYFTYNWIEKRPLLVESLVSVIFYEIFLMRYLVIINYYFGKKITENRG